MDPVGSSIVRRRTDEVVSEEKSKSKIVALVNRVREAGTISPRLRPLRRAKPDVKEPASKPAHRSQNAPTVIWSPDEILEAKKTIENVLDDLARLIPITRLSSFDKQKHALNYIKGLKAILKARVCHADLKPENILWGKNSFVISDFNGSLLIDQVCTLMNPDFIFESEEEKALVKRIVQNLVDPLAARMKSPYRPTLEKLVAWEIIDRCALENYSKAPVHDTKKLQVLREYVATKVQPLPTKGYASDHYRNAMGNYFWRCEKENFVLACHAYDMRAAALTIYAILTGASPPDVEDDARYYETLENSLLAFGLSKKAAIIIRKMAEPLVPPLGQPFVLRVDLEELSELEIELFQDESPCIMVESSSDEEESDLKNLTLLQEALGRLNLLNGQEDEKEEKVADDLSIIKQITDDLIGSKSAIHIDSKTRLELIEGAFAAYPNACETFVEASNGVTYSTVLLIDPDNLESCDVLLKEAKIGDGGSAVAYKAFSLRSSRYVVIKYFLERADPLEANNSKNILEHIGPHDAIQPCPKLFSLQRNEDYKQVAVEPYYEHCDYASCIFGDLFCSNWKIPKEQDAIRRVLKEIDTRLQEVLCRESSSLTEKQAHVHALEQEYAKMFIGILGQQKEMNLFAAYRILATATPISRLRSLSRDCHDQDAATQLVQKCIRVLRNLSIIDPEELENTIEAEFSSQKEEIKQKAIEVMVQSIRTCQKEVFQEWLHKSKSNENPVTAAKEWKKKAITFGESHLDLLGIKRICKAIHIDGKIGRDPESIHQKTLVDLNKIVERIRTL